MHYKLFIAQEQYVSELGTSPPCFAKKARAVSTCECPVGQTQATRAEGVAWQNRMASMAAEIVDDAAMHAPAACAPRRCLLERLVHTYARVAGHAAAAAPVGRSTVLVHGVSEGILLAGSPDIGQTWVADW